MILMAHKRLKEKVSKYQKYFIECYFSVMYSINDVLNEEQ